MKSKLLRELGHLNQDTEASVSSLAGFASSPQRDQFLNLSQRVALPLETWLCGCCVLHWLCLSLPEVCPRSQPSESLCFFGMRDSILKDVNAWTQEEDFLVKVPAPPLVDYDYGPISSSACASASHLRDGMDWGTVP